MVRDSRLDVIRVLAMTMIVCCHFLQVIGSLEISFWFNSGVQIFFVLSAFLQGKRSLHSVSEGWKFIRKRYTRIMAPLWIYLVSIVLAMMVMRFDVKPNAVIMYALGLAAFSKKGVLGLGHLWYITVILVCYAMVPIVNLVSHKVKRRSVQLGILGLISLGWGFLFWRCSFIAYGVNVLYFTLMTHFFITKKDAEDERK